MDRKQFWQILRSGYSYQSPSEVNSMVRRHSTIATVLYYAGLMRILYRHSVVAGRGLYTREKWADGSVEVISLVESVGGSIRISGLGGLLRYPGPFVFVANHMSMIDAFFLPGIILAFSDVAFVVKQSLLNYPVFGNIMRAVNPIAVSRKNPREDLKTVLEYGQKTLENGCSVVVFPQSTRRTIFDPLHFNTLGVKLASKAGVCAVPVALKTDFQGYSAIFKDLGRIEPRKTIHIHFGEPMVVDKKTQKTHEGVVRFIVEHLNRWGGELAGLPSSLFQSHP